MSLRLFVCLLAAVPGIAFALSLGEASGQVILGQPLAVRIPLDGTDLPSLRADCVKLLTVPGDLSENRIISGMLKLDGRSLVISSPLAVAQPLMSFRIRVDCGWNLTKDFQLLPEPPSASTATAAAIQAVIPAPAPPVQELPDQVPAAARLGVSEPTTLRMMSRQRYPMDSGARVAFIRRVAAANPEVFASIGGAYDQPLPAGTQLRMPPTPPPRASTGETRPRRAAPPRESARKKASAKGRLIIGPDALPSRSNDALAADLDRLVDVANAQIQIQIAMAERLAKMEDEVEQTKRAFAAQHATNLRLEAELRELREEQRRSSYIQLVMAILLGGSGVAAFLLWRGQSRAREPAEVGIAFAASVPIARSAPPPKAELQSIFDDLLPPR
ncbi:MAG: hypothetical protein HZA62_03095 [Rhodocyclales bacterium]|nr:hypothetical protein [Rhodocyclales bacterium]